MGWVSFFECIAYLTIQYYRQSRSATTVIPSWHVPQGGTLGDRAATLPGGYYYAGMDGTLNSHFSDRKFFITIKVGLFK